MDRRVDVDKGDAVDRVEPGPIAASSIRPAPARILGARRGERTGQDGQMRFTNEINDW